MPTTLQRPDPDLLLRRVSAEEAQDARAKLKIFFGFAPGVGKTFRMLQAARELAAQHINVLVGVVETHRRSDTAELLVGLESIAKRNIEYRGQVIEEFDLDEALARKPHVILVDELAHSNVAGSRHKKRWQDVFELLDAGINVYTTLNVQHVESLNDVIAKITHVQVRETVPDFVLDRADEIELIDIAPEELLVRLREGKVYLPDQAAHAIDHFFQQGNLLALRELALRRTAERVDVDVQAYREAHGIDQTWQTSEKILVCVGPAPSSSRLIRAAKRMAVGLKASWVAAYVDASLIKPMNAEDKTRLEAHLRLVDSLGGTVVRLSGPSIGDAILTYARKYGITRIVVGKPTHSRVWDRVRGSLLDDIVRGSGDIDVHVITGDDAPSPDARPHVTQRDPFFPRPYGWALVNVSVTTVIATFVRTILNIPDVEMLYLLAVMLTAYQFGLGPSLFAATLSVAAYDFFFVLPYLTFAVADARYLLTFVMMFTVGGVMSALMSRIRNHEKESLSREAQTAALYALSRDLGKASGINEIAAAAASHACEVLGVSAVIFSEDGARNFAQIASSPETVFVDNKDVTVAMWTYEHGRVAGIGTDTLPGSRVLCAPLVISETVSGVLLLIPHERFELTAERREFLETFCRQVAFAFERVRLEEEAKRTALRAKSEELRSSLLSTVSHDLRTPLAAITGAATALRDRAELPSDARDDLLDTVCEEAQRLERFLANILEMTRLDSSEFVPKREWVPLVEVIESSLTRLEEQLADHSVRTQLPDELTLVYVDPVLIEQLLINLLENATKYTPKGTTIDVVARVENDELKIDVMDYGPGISKGEEQRIFDRFHRGDHPGVLGMGLGLPICRSIAHIHNGTLVAENCVGGGACFRLTIPQPEAPPPHLNYDDPKGAL